jgi:hypothetical protein
MHRKQHLKILPAALMLVLFLAVSFVSAEGTLLCFGKDGHVAIEFVDICNGSSPGSELERTASDACGPCQDIQLLSSPANTNNASSFTKTFPLASLSQLAASLPLKENPGYIELPQSPHHKTLASLHSVVLLI